MVFEEKKEGLKLKHHSKYFNITLESIRIKKIAILKAVYENEVGEYISSTKIVKIAIDNLVNDLEKLPEEEAVELLEELAK